MVLPPRYAKLATKPCATGSITVVNTFGTVRVACCAARKATLELAKITSGGRIQQFRHGDASPLVIGRIPAIVDLKIAADNPAKLLEFLPESREPALSFLITFGELYHYSNPPHPLGLLRTSRKRPREGRAADKGDELAALHSITSSAVARSDGAMVTPSALAVFRLIAISNSVGCWTGKSLGLAPFRMRST